MSKRTKAPLKNVPPIFKPPKPGRGRPAWQPTAKQRIEARDLFRGNVPLFRVAQYFDKDEDTIKLHFADEMREARFKVFQLAVSKMVVNITKADQRAIEFFLNTQGKEFGFATRTEHTGANGKDLFALLASADLAKLDAKQIGNLKDVLVALGASEPD